MGISHPMVERESGESGSSTVGVTDKVRDGDGSLRNVTVIWESWTEIIPTLRTPHRPMPFQSSVQIEVSVVWRDAKVSIRIQPHLAYLRGTQ